MVGSLAYRKNEDAIRRGDVPEKYIRLLPYITGDRVIEIGSAEGVLALLLTRKDVGNRPMVMAMEANPERHVSALRLEQSWRQRFSLRGDPGISVYNGDIRENLDLLAGMDTLVAVRMVYYLRGEIDRVFSEVAKHIKTVVLCGNRNRADRWRAGRPDEPLGDFNRYAAREGMRELLERHGYRISKEVTDGDEIVVGVMD